MDILIQWGKYDLGVQGEMLEYLLVCPFAPSGKVPLQENAQCLFCLRRKPGRNAIWGQGLNREFLRCQILS